MSHDRIWIDRLSPASLRAALGMCAREGIARIEYLALHPSGGDRALARRLPAGVTLSALDYDLATLRTADGCGLRYVVNDMVAARLPAALIQQLGRTGLAHSLPHLTDDEVFTALLRTGGQTVVPAVALALLAAATRAAVGSPLLFINHDAAVLAGEWPVFDRWPYRSYGALGPGLARWAGLLGAAILALRELAGAHVRGIAASSDAWTTPRIAVQLQPPDGDDSVLYPWYPASGFDSSQICVYADRPDALLTGERREEIARRGHAWIQFRAGLLAGPWRRPYVTRVRASIRESLRVIATASRSKHPLAGWEGIARLWLLWRAAFWEAVCRRHRIAAVLHYFDTGPQMIAQAAGVRLAGGISIGRHWSHLPFASAQHARYASTFFAWGPFYRPVLETDHLRATQLVYTGLLPFRTAKRLCPAPADRLRAAGARHVVCLFDTSAGPVAEMGYSQRAMVALYERLMQEVVREREVGLIIKPKNPGIPDRTPELGGLLVAARATGRMIELSFDVAPQDGARGADLVVCYGLNTAGIEAAVDGEPVVYADLDGAAGNPFYDWGRGTVIFDSIEGLMTAVRRHRAQGNGSGIGDHGPILASIDPFGDGRGHQRMGWYLKTYLDHLTTHGDAAAAHRHAGEMYRQRYGAESVVFDGEEPSAPMATGGDRVAQVLRGNFTPQRPVDARTAADDDLTAQFEREALKRLGGSVAFVAKKKFLFTGEAAADAATVPGAAADVRKT